MSLTLPGTMPYDEFLREKVAFDRRFGFEVDPTAVNPILKPHPASVTDSLVYLRRHDARASVPTLFDLLDGDAA